MKIAPIVELSSAELLAQMLVSLLHTIPRPSQTLPVKTYTRAQTSFFLALFSCSCQHAEVPAPIAPFPLPLFSAQTMAVLLIGMTTFHGLGRRRCLALKWT